ncbi:helix-turn-helix transcriptional regulator [Allomuricauda taeanensis]|uniref:helix-turn-helix domain-containing protein n=1 Tax=Flagellimonas taeanensis TaxID=1005926 RepID=UPI002E7B81A2|nr:helix-turn-helix transcriptional regulator [Allomuricauda taeanensis]MEE1964329.1 helix-turn-helix transcriptional regulator [Allomuricauda taeanensis]
MIQDRRNQLRITQEQLAEMAEVGVVTLYKIEKGEANPTLASLQRITDVLGLDVTLVVKELTGRRDETGKDLL